MKFIVYISVLMCAMLALARGESLGRVQRSPVPITDPGPDPHHGHYDNYHHGDYDDYYYGGHHHGGHHHGGHHHGGHHHHHGGYFDYWLG